MADSVIHSRNQILVEKGISFRVNIPNAKEKTTLTLKEIRNNPKHLEKTSLEKLEKDWNDARA